MAVQKKFSAPVLHFIGLSSDRRTNRWQVSCVCGHNIAPPTTMLARQDVTCERCNRVYLCNYNEETIKEIV